MIKPANPKTGLQTSFLEPAKGGLQTSSLEPAEGGVRRKDPTVYGPAVPEYQETIQIRPRSADAAVATHPFKIRVEDGELYVRWGMVNVMRVFNDVDDKPYPTPTLCSTQINALALEGDPDGGTVGSLTVLDDEVYGVWIELDWSVIGPFDKTGITYGQFVTWDLVTYTVSPNVIISEVATDGSSASLMPTTSMKSYLFIGRVTLVAGAATIAQYLTSDVIIPGSIIPNQILSADNVDLFIGVTDGGIGYDDP